LIALPSLIPLPSLKPLPLLKATPPIIVPCGVCLVVVIGLRNVLRFRVESGIGG